MKVIRESYRAGESWPFFVTLERGEEIRGYFRVNYDVLLALADDIDKQTDGSMFDIWLEDGHYIARRIREALGVK